MSICETFPNLSPFEIRKQKFTEVLLLVRRLNNRSSKKGKEAHMEEINGKKRYYVPVTK